MLALCKYSILIIYTFVHMPTLYGVYYAVVNKYIALISCVS